MKKLTIIIAFLATLSACKKNDTTPTNALSCRVTQMVLNNGTYDFSYDTKGNISEYSITTMTGTDKQVLRHVFAYNASNKLSSATQTFAINGIIQGTAAVANLSYSGELLTAQSYTQIGGTEPFATATLKYNANKRLIEHDYTNKSSNYSSITKYEYDNNGNCIKYLTTDSDNTSDESLFTYDSNKNPEQIIAKLIPFDFATGLVWNNNMALTFKETYDYGPGDMGVITGKRTNIKTDSKGNVISSTYTDDANSVTNETYTLSNCN